MPSSHTAEQLDSLQDRYEVTELVAGGNKRYGPTHLFVEKDHRGRRFVVKTIDSNKLRCLDRTKRHRYLSAVHDEMDVLRTVHHPNIAKVHHIIDEPNGSQNATTFRVSTEELSGGSLYDRFSNTPTPTWTEQDAAKMIRQVLSGLDYMHRDNRMVHHHLSPKKIRFVSSDHDLVKIVGFGVSKLLPVMMSNDGFDELQDAPYFMAPELLPGGRRKKSQSKAGHAADMWSVGVILFVMVYGFCPFTTDSAKYGSEERDALYQRIRGGLKGKGFPKHIAASRSVKVLITKLLHPKPKKRITAREALRHSWIVNLGQSEGAPLPPPALSLSHHFHGLSEYKSTLNTLFQSQYGRLKPRHLRDLHALCAQYDNSSSNTLSPYQFEQAVDSLIMGSYADGLSVDTNRLRQAHHKLLSSQFVELFTSSWFRIIAPGQRLSSHDITPIIRGYLSGGLPDGKSSDLPSKLSPTLQGPIGIRYKGFMSSLAHDFVAYSEGVLCAEMSTLDRWQEGKIQTKQALNVYLKVDPYDDEERALEIASALECGGEIDYELFLAKIRKDLAVDSWWSLDDLMSSSPHSLSRQMS